MLVEAAAAKVSIISMFGFLIVLLPWVGSLDIKKHASSILQALALEGSCFLSLAPGCVLWTGRTLGAQGNGFKAIKTSIIVHLHQMCSVLILELIKSEICV